VIFVKQTNKLINEHAHSGMWYSG